MSESDNQETIECPQCRERLGEVPNHVLVDQFQLHCSECEEFVEISTVRQIEKECGDSSTTSNPASNAAEDNGLEPPKPDAWQKDDGKIITLTSGDYWDKPFDYYWAEPQTNGVKSLVKQWNNRMENRFTAPRQSKNR